MVNNSKSSDVGLSKGLCRFIKILAILFGAFAALEGFGGGVPKFIQKAKEGKFDFAEMGIYVGIGLSIAGIVIVFRRTRRGAAFMIIGGVLIGIGLLLYEQTREAKLLLVIFSLPFILFGLVLLFCRRQIKNKGSTQQDIL
jgi:hypothetical protein